MVFSFWEKCIKCCTSKCNMHSTECLDLKPLTGCGRSMRKKAGDSSPEHQESSHDTEASKRAGSNKKRESYAYMYYSQLPMLWRFAWEGTHNMLDLTRPE